MSMQKRWMVLHLHGIGDVAAETEHDLNVNHALTVRRMTQLRVIRKVEGGPLITDVAPMHGYALGLLVDPVSIQPSAIAWASLAGKQLAETCEGAWAPRSNIQIAKSGDLKRLDGDV